MKIKFIMLGLAMIFVCTPVFASPGGHNGGHAPAVRAANYYGGVSYHRPHVGTMHRPSLHHIGVRPLPPPPQLYRPYRPVYRPYYTTTYYSCTYYPSYNYGYEVVQPVPAAVNTVVVRDNYAGVNTAANIINTAANVASTIRYLTW